MLAIFFLGLDLCQTTITDSSDRFPIAAKEELKIAKRIMEMMARN